MSGTQADYTRTCKWCRFGRPEEWKPGSISWRCFAPGTCAGYTVTDKNGHFFPYVPAWCPPMNRGEDDYGTKLYRPNQNKKEQAT